MKRKKLGKFLYWTPRILSILFLAFVAMFSLDVFDNNYGFWGTILALFMHNIPVFILIIALVISWKHEIVGGIAFILAGLLYIFWLVTTKLTSTGFQGYYLLWILNISVPAFLIGILFILGWIKRKNKHKIRR
jgi:ABC-type multidrug transport system permease subunit